MPCKRGIPTFTSKKKSIAHGYITYGKTKSGRRKFRVYKTKKGWNVVAIKHKRN